MTTAVRLAPERTTRHAGVGTGNRASDLIAIGCIAACALAVHRDGLTGGPAFYELDTRLFYFPLAQWVGQQLHSGSFPLWMPSIFTGYPIFADGELGLAYLPQLALLAALPTPLAMVWLRVLHVFLAGLFTFVYLRALRLDTLPALGGSLIFALGSFMSAQMHHENVVRSAVWLPAVLACLERGQLHWTAPGAVAFAMSALGLHVQPVLMAAMAIGGYALFRAVRFRRQWRGELARGAGILAGGLALAAVQWLPLGEWALVSSRRGGVEYVFGSAFALPPVNLLGLIFPFFFRLPDASTWWSLWQQWEIELYVGIPTLVLMLVAIAFSRRIELVYFLLLGLISLWIAMAEYAPVFNLHQLLWNVPGFSFLRAPGRFTYLVVFACACTAAFGLQVLGHRRSRLFVALLGGVPAVASLATLLIMLPVARGWLAAEPTRAAAWAESTYLATRAQYPIDPQLVVAGFLASLDISAVKTTWSLALLGLTSLAFAAWLLLGPRRARIGQALFVGLLGADLLVFAFDFHPRAPLSSLTPAPDGMVGERVLMHDPVDLPQFEPNQLVADGAQLADGYSSLPSQRHVELRAATSADPRLFDLWSAPLILEPPNPADLREVDGVRFRVQHPLMAGFGGSPTQTFNLPQGIGTVRGLRLIGTLSYAFNAPEGQTVATVTIGGESMPIRAGVELSERAYDRPSLTGLVQHQKARVALDFEETTPEGEDYTAHLYEADLQAAAPVSATSFSITPNDPRVLVEVHGVGVIDAQGDVRSLDLAARDALKPMNNLVLQNSHALPRAYLLPLAEGFSPARHPGLTATQLVASPDVDLHTMVLIENDPNTASSPSGSQAVVAATSVEDLGADVVRVTATADGPSYLVLDDFYHRGWTAHVDGQPTRVFIANALFRAVEIEAGTHVVEFRFEPISHLVGAAISAVSLLICALVVLSAPFVRRG